MSIRIIEHRTVAVIGQSTAKGAKPMLVVAMQAIGEELNHRITRPGGDPMPTHIEFEFAEMRYNVHVDPIREDYDAA